MRKKIELAKVTIETRDIGEERAALVYEGEENPYVIQKPNWVAVKQQLLYYLTKNELANEEEIKKLEEELFTS
ncbi:hypothetical protein ACQCU1_01835 [Sutcliffiella horikoshii]|uniref:hypothetical protein n=1 Tax=Sutcliffiella horikoshii TaxID=79883 RepID=UPI003CEDCC7A